MLLTDKISAIADAIRAKTGTEGKITLDQMPLKIAGIQTGGGDGVTEPYVYETYDSEGNLISAKLVGHTKVRDFAFGYCSELALIELPADITSIGKAAFKECPKLALIELPADITFIGRCAFRACSKLALTELPAELKNIDIEAFQGCTGLTSITFKGTPDSIDSTAFDDCTNLTTINVPWAEGEVANAPWGATNATINYNYTGG